MKSLLLLALCALLKYAGAACYDGTGGIILCSTCEGSCTSDNGCLCGDNIESCIPATSECPAGDNTCCTNLESFFWDSSSQCCSQTPFCYPSCPSDESCTVVNNKATCVCNPETYKGITVKDLKSHVNCDGGAMTVSVSMCQLKELGYDYKSLHIINKTIQCTYEYSDTYETYEVESLQLRAAIDWCGNTVFKNGSKIYFQNTLYINPNSGPLITRNILGLNFTCGYNLTMQTSLSFALNPIQSIHYLTSLDGSGEFAVTMAAYRDSDYTDPIQETDIIEVESMVYLGLFSPTLDGSTFVLRVERCFGTPTDNPADTNQLVFVSGGCAAQTDVKTIVDENGNSTQARIQTSAFLFDGFNQVYIYCDVSLCNKTDDCESCNPGRTAVTSVRMGVQVNIDSSYTSSGHNIAVSWALLAASLLGLIVKLF